MPPERNSRRVTVRLLEMAECGTLTWEAIARGCLQYMSEFDVKEMAESECLIDVENDESTQPEEEDDDT